MSIDRKKILFIDHTPFVGGAQLFLIDHLLKLDKEKFVSFIACSEKARENGLYEKYLKKRVKVFFVPIKKIKRLNLVIIIHYFKSLFALKRIVKANDINCIVCNTVRSCVISFPLSFFTNAKIVWLIHDFTFNKFLFSFLKIFPKFIVFNSYVVANFYKEKLNKKYFVVYPGSNFFEKSIDINKDNVAKKRIVWGVGRHDVVVGFVGRLVDWKGPLVLLDVAKCFKKNDRIKFVFVGSGKDQEGDVEERMKIIVREEKMKNVVFSGFEDNMRLVFSLLDVLCVVSQKPEPYGLVVIEAMQSRVPVVSTKFGGPAEIIDHNKTGILVDGSTREICDAINALNDSKFRENIINNAFIYAKNNHNVKSATKNLEKLYLRV